MLKKVRSGKGVNLILVVSMIGMGAFSYIPTAYAAMDQKSVNADSVEEQKTAALSKLEIEGVQLDQAFSADVKSYSATVENNVQQISLLAESDNPEATITINGQQVTSGTSGTYLLHTGENTFLISVDDGSQTPTTYTLIITKKQNNNNLLQDIKLSKGELSPKFDSRITEYTVGETNDVDSITLTAETAEKTSSIMVNETLLNTEGRVVSLPIGKSDITLVVTAENGDKKTYILHVTREDKKIIPTPVPTKPIPKTPESKNKNHTTTINKTKTGFKPTNNNIQKSAAQQSGSFVQKTSTATMSSLTVSSGTWNKTFSSGTYTYHIAVASNVTTVTLNPDAKYSDAVISINGGNGRTIQLDGSKTIIPVLVTRGDDRKTYVLVFDKAVQPTTTTTTTPITATANTTVASTTGTVDRGAFNNQAQVRTTMPNGSKSTTSTSLWSRIINSISTFFSKFF